MKIGDMIVTDKVEVYRLKLRRGTTSNWPDWRLYESKGDFESDLLEALIEEAANYHNRSPFVGACRAWIEHMFNRDRNYRAVVRVIGAEQLIDGEWVELKPRLVPPSLEYDRE